MQQLFIVVTKLKVNVFKVKKKTQGERKLHKFCNKGINEFTAKLRDHREIRLANIERERGT